MGPYERQFHAKMWKWSPKVDKCRERRCQPEELYFMLKTFAATCFGSCIRNHYQVDNVPKKCYRVEDLISFYVWSALELSSCNIIES